MKLFDYNIVVCLSPHPDDVEYSMSGTIEKFKETKFINLVLSMGTTSDITSTGERNKEVEVFWGNLGVKNLKTIFLNQKFDVLDDGKWIDVIEQELDFTKIDAIFATSSEDTHYEHQITNRLLHTLGRNKKISLYEYKSPSTKNNWVSNFYVEIDDFYENKVKYLLKSFISQLDALYFNKKLLNLFNSNFNISKLGTNKIENFRIIRKIINN